LINYFNNGIGKKLTFKIKVMELKHFAFIIVFMLIAFFAFLYFLDKGFTTSRTETPSYPIEKEQESVKVERIAPRASFFDYEETGEHSATITMRQDEDEGTFWAGIILPGQPDSVLLVFDSTFTKNPVRVIHVSNTLHQNFHRK